MIARKKAYYAGIPTAPYDLVKEFLMAMGIMTALVVILAIGLSSPDVPPLTMQSIAKDTPQIFVQTSLDSLDGSSDISSYGPPYNDGAGSVQYIGPISLQKLFGVRIPVNTAQDFVLTPLTQASATDAHLHAALNVYTSASADQQAKWTDAYNTALSKAKESPPNLAVPVCACGPVTTMMSAMLKLGQTGAMDGLLLNSQHFYQTDFTRPLLFMQNDAVENKAAQYNLLGSQWGVMNETGNYPGQAWLWLYTMLYQIWPYNGPWAANADAMAIFTVSILSLLLVLVPWIPIVNRIPRYIPIYRLIWKDWYKNYASKAGESQ